MRKITMFSFLVFVSFVSACTSVGFQKTEDTLSAAGFQMKIADTPKKMALLKSMTQNKIIIHPKNGINYYIYADAAGCQCIYGGKDINYQQYQQLRIAQNFAVEQEATAQLNLSAMMNWGAWGPWGPGFY